MLRAVPSTRQVSPARTLRSASREARLERRTARYGRGTRLRGTSSLTAASFAGGLLAVGGLVAGSGLAWAAPEGGTVVEGVAEIVQTSPTSIEIRQSTDKVIIEWQSFDIGAGESVSFIQPGELASALNRVLSGQTSAILGNLTANGQIVISNPSGIKFGAGARVDVASIVATSLGILNQNFMAGRMIFDQPGDPGAMVSNAGQITAKQGGLAALVAPGVENSGTITARLGAVALAAGNAAVLDFYGDGLVQLAITAPVTQAPVGPDGEPVGSLVSNTGGIYADGGTVVLTAEAAEGVLNRVVNLEGVVQAQTIESHEGQVALVGGGTGEVRVAGTVDASGTDAGEKGGTVHVLGASVQLADGASVDVSGDAGGGTVLIGGDKQGQALERTSGLAYKKNDTGGTTIVISKDLESDGSIQHAQVTYFGAGATADASATTSGDGGKVIVWADQTTAFHGSISVEGAPDGSGGFVETSARSVSFSGNVALGDGGHWLVDPAEDTIGAAEWAAVQAALNALGAQTFEYTTVGAASQDMTFTASGNLTVNDPGDTLNLIAHYLDPTENTVAMSGGILNINILAVNPGGTHAASVIQNAINAVDGTNAAVTTINVGDGTFTGGSINLNKSLALVGDGFVATTTIEVPAGGYGISVWEDDTVVTGFLFSAVSTHSGTGVLIDGARSNVLIGTPVADGPGTGNKFVGLHFGVDNTEGTSLSVEVNNNVFENTLERAIDVESTWASIVGNEINGVGTTAVGDVYGIRVVGEDLYVSDNTVNDVYTMDGNAFGIAAFGVAVEAGDDSEDDFSGGDGFSQVWVEDNHVNHVNASPAYLDLGSLDESTGAAFGILASSGGLVVARGNQINQRDRWQDYIGGDLLAVGIALLGIDDFHDDLFEDIFEDFGNIDELPLPVGPDGFGNFFGTLGLGQVYFDQNIVHHIYSPSQYTTCVSACATVVDGAEYYGGVAIGEFGLGDFVQATNELITHVHAPVAAIGGLYVATGAPAFEVANVQNEDTNEPPARACDGYFALCVSNNEVKHIVSDLEYGGYYPSIPIGNDTGGGGEDYDTIGGIAVGILSLSTTGELKNNLVGMEYSESEDEITDAITEHYDPALGVIGSLFAGGIVSFGIGPVEVINTDIQDLGAGVNQAAIVGLNPYPPTLFIHDNWIANIESRGLPADWEQTDWSGLTGLLGEEFGGLFSDASSDPQLNGMLDGLYEGGWAVGILGASLWDTNISGNNIGLRGTIDDSGTQLQAFEPAFPLVDGAENFGVYAANGAFGIVGVSLGLRVVIDGGENTVQALGQGIAALDVGEIRLDIIPAPPSADRSFLEINDNHLNAISAVGYNLMRVGSPAPVTGAGSSTSSSLLGGLGQGGFGLELGGDWDLGPIAGGILGISLADLHIGSDPLNPDVHGPFTGNTIGFEIYDVFDDGFVGMVPTDAGVLGYGGLAFGITGISLDLFSMNGIGGGGGGGGFISAQVNGNGVVASTIIEDNKISCVTNGGGCYSLFGVNGEEGPGGGGGPGYQGYAWGIGGLGNGVGIWNNQVGGLVSYDGHTPIQASGVQGGEGAIGIVGIDLATIYKLFHDDGQSGGAGIESAGVGGAANGYGSYLLPPVDISDNVVSDIYGPHFAIGIAGVGKGAVSINRNQIGAVRDGEDYTQLRGVHSWGGLSVGILGLGLGKSHVILEEEPEDLQQAAFTNGFDGEITTALQINDNLVSDVTTLQNRMIFVPLPDSEIDSVGTANTGFGGIGVGIFGYAKGYAEINGNDVGGFFDSSDELVALNPIYGDWFSAGILGVSKGKVKYPRNGESEPDPLTSTAFNGSGGWWQAPVLTLDILNTLAAQGDLDGELGDKAAKSALIIDGNTVHGIGHTDVGIYTPCDCPQVVSGENGYDDIGLHSQIAIGIGGFAKKVAITDNYVGKVHAQWDAFGILAAGTPNLLGAIHFFKDNPFLEDKHIGFNFEDLYGRKGYGYGKVIVAGNDVYDIKAAPSMSPAVQATAAQFDGAERGHALGIGAVGFKVNVADNTVEHVSATSYDGGEPVRNHAGGILAVSVAGAETLELQAGSANSEEGPWEIDLTKPLVSVVGNTVIDVYAGCRDCLDESIAYGILAHGPTIAVINNHAEWVAAPGAMSRWGDRLGGDGIVIVGTHEKKPWDGENDQNSTANSEGGNGFYPSWAVADGNTSIWNTGNGMLVRDLKLAYISRNVLGGIVFVPNSVDGPTDPAGNGMGYGWSYDNLYKAGDGLRVQDVKKLFVFNNHINFNYGNGVNLVGGVKWLEMYENYIHENHKNGVLIGKKNWIHYSFDTGEETPSEPLLQGTGFSGWDGEYQELPTDPAVLATLESSFKINFNSIVGNGIASEPNGEVPSGESFASGSEEFGYSYGFYDINNKAYGVVDGRANWFGTADRSGVADRVKTPLFLTSMSASSSSENGKKSGYVLVDPFLTSGTDGNQFIKTGLHPFGFQPGQISDLLIAIDQNLIRFIPPGLGVDPSDPGTAWYFWSNLNQPYRTGIFTALYGLGGTAPGTGGALEPAAGDGGEDDSCVEDFFANYAPPSCAQ